MIVLLILGFLAVGVTVFSISAGTLLFGSLFIRKKDTSSLDPEVIKQAVTALKHAAPGSSLRGVEMPGPSARLAAHLNDKRIMIPLLEAKLRWFDLCSSGNTVERLLLKGFRGVTLAGFAVEPASASENSRRVALLVHGYSDSAAGMAYLAEEYLKRGVTVVSVDCRAHGLSGGNIITMGYIDAFDISSWIAFLSQKYGSNTQFILHGVSMGAAAVLQTLSYKPFQQFVPNIAAAVADCGFSSAKDQLACQIGLVIGTGVFQRFVGRLIIAGISLVNGIMSGFFLGQDSPVKALKKRQRLPACGVPLVLFHGDEDVMVSPRMTDELEAAAGSCNVSVMHVPGAPHIGSYFYEPELYMQRIFDAAEKNSRNTDNCSAQTCAPDVSAEEPV